MDTKKLRMQDYLNTIRDIVVEVVPDKDGLGMHSLYILAIFIYY